MKTSGSKGFHVVVPLDGTADFDEVAAFAHRAGALLVKRHPERLTQEFLKADRGGRVLVDTGRNGWSATFAAAYTVRARPGAPVSAPCSWSEVERGEVGPRSFTLRSMAERLDAVGDLWADLPASGAVGARGERAAEAADAEGTRRRSATPLRESRWSRSRGGDERRLASHDERGRGGAGRVSGATSSTRSAAPMRTTPRFRCAARCSCSRCRWCSSWCWSPPSRWWTSCSSPSSAHPRWRRSVSPRAYLFLVYAVAMGLAMAVTAVVARRIGEGKPEEAANTAVQAILVARAGVAALRRGRHLLRARTCCG